MRLTRFGSLILGLLVVAVSTSCSTTNGGTDDSVGRVCVNTRAIRSFDALTDRYVYVKEGSNKHYLFTMRYRCQDLSDAMTIAITDTVSTVCSKGFGEIRYSNQLERKLDSCPIDTIERISSKEQAKEMVKTRTGSRN